MEKHRWNIVGSSGIHRCERCGAERSVSRGGNIVFGIQKGTTYRRNGRSEWTGAYVPCRNENQLDFFDDYVPDDTDLAAEISSSPRPSASPVHVRKEPAREVRRARSGRSITLRGAGWGEAPVDAHRTLGIERWRGPPCASPRDEPVDLETLRERGFAVTFETFDDEVFEFGILAEGVPLEVDSRWITASTEARVLRRCLHAMGAVAAHLASRGFYRGARAALKNHTTGEVFLWKLVEMTVKTDDGHLEPAPRWVSSQG